MNGQIGISSIGAALVTAAVVGGGAGAYAWYQHQGLVQARGELAQARAQTPHVHYEIVFSATMEVMRS